MLMHVVVGEVLHNPGNEKNSSEFVEPVKGDGLELRGGLIGISVEAIE